MKLTIGVKLKPTATQAAALRETLELANKAAAELRVRWHAGDAEDSLQIGSLPLLFHRPMTSLCFLTGL
jgi:hypothetical protein